MASTIAAPSPADQRAHSRPPATGPGRRSRGPMQKRTQGGRLATETKTAPRRGREPLGRYTDGGGREREVLAGRLGDGCMLVVDRDTLTLGDRRLVAHLAADEPDENAALVCAQYLSDASRGRCRRVSAEDLSDWPSGRHSESPRLADGSPHGSELIGRRGENSRHAYRLELVDTDAAVMELRWRRHARRGAPQAPVAVYLREVIGAVESYEPVYGLTLQALAMYRDDPRVCGKALHNELERVRESPIVLNRKLRQAVLAAVQHRSLSMSEIAHRCGRVKRDCKGNASGETSWLARRVGVLPESSTKRFTPWIHSDVLALIARNGLGISPREVELV
jgi:hypothetical protein